jgi:hypothetical protein
MVGPPVSIGIRPGIQRSPSPQRIRILPSCVSAWKRASTIERFALS